MHLNVEAGDSFGNDLLHRIANDIYEGSIAAGGIDDELLERTASTLLDAIKNGFSGFDEFAPDNRISQRIRENIFVFSGAKTFHQLNDMRNLLMDENGKVRSFSDFYKQVKSTDATYNRNYLNAEYGHALNCATMIDKWQDIVADKKALPYLRYDTMKDERVREEHAVLDGTVLPVDDPFWKTWYPPNGWGCRCDVTQLGPDAAIKQPQGYPDPQKVKPMFMNNVGMSGVVFPEKHPYFEVSKKVRQAIADAALDVMRARYKYEEIKISGPNPKKVKVYAHPDAKQNKNEFANNVTMAKSLAIHTGKDVYLSGIINMPGVKNPDAKIGGEKWEFKHVNTTNAESIGKRIQQAKNQAGRIAISINQKVDLSALERVILKRVLRHKSIEVIAIKYQNRIIWLTRETVLGKRGFLK